jgi:hypothetical protein
VHWTSGHGRVVPAVAWHGYALPATRDRDVGSCGVEVMLVTGDGGGTERGVEELSCWGRSSTVFRTGAPARQRRLERYPRAHRRRVGPARSAAASGHHRRTHVHPAARRPVPSGLPVPHLPEVTFEDVKMLLLAGLGITIVGYSDIMLIARGFPLAPGRGRGNGRPPARSIATTLRCSSPTSTTCASGSASS